MGIDANQLRDVIVTPVLAALGLHSPSAVNLVLGTAAQETHMGKYLVQIGIGFKGGIGIYQMEAATYQSLWNRIIIPSVSLRSKFKLFLGYEAKPPPERMASDLWLATAMTRLHYYAINSALPAANDLPGLANYWKRWYNTALGKGTEEEFIKNYQKYVVT